MKLEFENIYSDKEIKRLTDTWNSGKLPKSIQSGIDTKIAKINDINAFEIRKEGVRKIKFILFIYDFSLISSMGSRLSGNKLKMGEYETFEEAEKVAQDHLDEFITLLNL